MSVATSHISETNPRGLQKKVDALKRLAKSKGGVVSVGVPKGSGEHKGSSLSLAEVAAINEFGSGDIPERSFLRSTIRKNKGVYAKLITETVKKIAEDPKREKQLLGLLGQKVQDDVKETIIRLKEPPNAASTIAQKGSDNPLIDTGQLLGSIRFVINGASL